MKVQFYIAVLFFFSLHGLVSAQSELPTMDEGRCKKSVDILCMKVGGRIRGQMLSETGDTYIIKNKRGKVFRVPSALVSKTEEKCVRKNRKKLRQDSSIPEFTHEFSFGNQFGWVNKDPKLFDYGFSDFVYYRYGHYRPNASVQHHISYEIRKGFGLRGGLGLTQFSNYNYYKSDIIQNLGVVTMPVFVGLQQHFWSSKKIHPYIKADYGRSIMNFVAPPKVFLNQKVLSSVSNKNILQGHIGLQHTLANKKGVFFELGFVRQDIESESTVFFTTSGSNNSYHIDRTFIKWSLRSGFTF